MQTDFPFVAIPDGLEPLIGRREPGTRIHRRDGSQEESAAWFDLLTEIIGPSVSPGGVGMYCPASRAAVYKRIKEGKLSIFLFHVTHQTTTLFGRKRTLRDNPYGYIPVSEARAWRQELEARAVRQGVVTEEELEGARPDWHGDFLAWRNKKERLGYFADMERDGYTRVGALKELARIVMSSGRSVPMKPPSKKRSRRVT